MRVGRRAPWTVAASAIAATVAVAAFALRVRAVNEDWDMPVRVFLGPLGLLLAGAASCGAVMLLLMRWRRRLPPIESMAAFGGGMVVLAAAAAAPVYVSYDDGCNRHDDLAPAVAAPYLMAAGPEDSALAYSGTTTLMACYPERG